MNLETRKNLLVRLGEFMMSDDELWEAVKRKASTSNHWFTSEFINLSAKNIATEFLEPTRLEKLVSDYHIPSTNDSPQKVGIVMAGNIPMVGFHDLLCVFLTGHRAFIKPSSKDDVLIPFLVRKMIEWNAEAGHYLVLSEMLKGCDAYIATGSNNSAKHFEYYFRNQPNLIRKNRTSVAILTGSESSDELERLADDVHLFFGLGCRNVTKVYVPHNYDFIPLLDAFNKYHYLINHDKYKNNYDFNLAILILNKREYMTNGSLLLVEEASVFSPISQLNYEYYEDVQALRNSLKESQDIQAIVGKEDVAFGDAQCPDICTFADGVDTIRFLLKLTLSNA